MGDSASHGVQHIPRLGAKSANGTTAKDARHAQRILGSACHGAEARYNPGQKNAHGTNATVVPLAQMACGACAAAKAAINIHQTKKCWFEQGVLCHMVFFLDEPSVSDLAQ